MEIQDFIKSRMKSSGLTYDELGERLGWTRQNVWLKLNKYKTPSYESIEKMLDALGYKIEIVKK